MAQSLPGALAFRFFEDKRAAAVSLVSYFPCAKAQCPGGKSISEG